MTRFVRIAIGVCLLVAVPTLARGETARARMVEDVARRIGNPEQVANKMYTTRGAEVVAGLKRIAPGFEVLAFHPGIAIRLPQFARFVEQHGLSGGSPEAALEKFKKSLGVAKVYRALALTDSQLKRVLKRGLESNYVQHGLDSRMDLKISDFLRKRLGSSLSVTVSEDRDPYRYGLDFEVLARVANWTVPRHPLMSVTEHADVALSVAKDYATLDKKIFLFELEVPRLDLLFATPKGVLRRPSASPRRRLVLRYPEGDEKSYPMASPKLESFVLFKLNASEIVNHVQVDTGTIASHSVIDDASGAPNRDQSR